MTPQGQAAHERGRLGQTCQRLEHLLQLIGCNDFSFRDAGQFLEHLGPGGFAGAFGHFSLDEERRVELRTSLLAGQIDLVLCLVPLAYSDR